MAYRKMTKAEVIAECRETFREFPETFRGEVIKMVTYGLCQHHVTDARIIVNVGRLNHDEAMRLLKVVYRRRKRIHDSLHAK